MCYSTQSSSTCTLTGDPKETPIPDMTTETGGHQVKPSYYGKTPDEWKTLSDMEKLHIRMDHDTAAGYGIKHQVTDSLSSYLDTSLKAINDERKQKLEIKNNNTNTNTNSQLNITTRHTDPTLHAPSKPTIEVTFNTHPNQIDLSSPSPSPNKNNQNKNKKSILKTRTHVHTDKNTNAYQQHHTTPQPQTSTYCVSTTMFGLLSQVQEKVTGCSRRITTTTHSYSQQEATEQEILPDFDVSDDNNCYLE